MKLACFPGRNLPLRLVGDRPALRLIVMPKVPATVVKIDVLNLDDPLADEPTGQGAPSRYPLLTGHPARDRRIFRHAPMLSHATAQTHSFGALTIHGCVGTHRRRWRPGSGSKLSSARKTTASLATATPF